MSGSGPLHRVSPLELLFAGAVAAIDAYSIISVVIGHTGVRRWWTASVCMAEGDELLFSLFSTLKLTTINHVDYADTGELIRCSTDYADSKACEAAFRSYCQ